MSLVPIGGRRSSSSVAMRVGGLGAVLALIAACGTAAPSPVNPTPTPAGPSPTGPAATELPPPEKVRVGVDSSTLAEAVFPFMTTYCPENGFNLDIEVLSVGARYFDRVLLLDQKEIDVGVGGYATIPRIVEEGLSVVGVAGANLATVDLIVRSGLEVREWKDLLGLRIGAPTGSIALHQILAGLEERGLDSSQVEFVQMLPGPQATVALAREDLDAVSGWEPWPSDMVTQGLGYHPFDSNDTEIGPISGVIMTHRDMVSEPKIQTFVDCYVDAAEYLMTNVEENIEAVRNWSGVSRAVAEHAVKRFAYDPKFYMENMKYYAAFMHREGLTQSDTSSRIDDPAFVTYDLLEAATGQSPDELGRVGKAKSGEVVPGRHPSNYEYGPRQ